MTTQGGDILNAVKQKLIDRFGDNILFNSCLWYSSGEENLRNLISGLKLKNVLEIGTMYGLSAAVLSEYCVNVYTIDIDDHDKKYDVWKFLGINNIYFNSKIKVEYDLVFIDGEHWKGQIKKDFEEYKNVKYILFHDYNEAHKEVKVFIDDLKGTKTIAGNFVLYESY